MGISLLFTIMIIVVKKVMVNFGINIDKIRIIARGESNLAIFTPDEVKHPANRRVVIKPSY